MARQLSIEAVNRPEQLVRTLNAMQTQITALTTLLTEWRTDHATLIASVGEIETWAEALATKLNSDATVADANYDATITNSPPATLTAAAPTAQAKKSL
jgi:hypothetical protein